VANVAAAAAGEKDDSPGIEGLTLEGGDDMVFGQSRRNPCRFLSARKMKRLFSSPDSATLGLLRSRLEGAGIECEIRNETVAQVMIGTPFDLELWVLKDEDLAQARELLAAWRRAAD
jgi:hypothetical protein